MDDTSVENVSAGQLRAFVERIEAQEERKREIADEIKEIYAEAKGMGFDTKALRKLVQIRRKSEEERAEEETILETYMAALGMR
jgi:uncharacterized protein (UPF0335 family)